MAYLYKTKGLSVATNDRLRFCEHIASAIIANRDTRLDDDATRALLADNPKAETFVQDQFVGIFFADGVHARIDTIRANIDSLDGFRKDIALFALAKTCMSSQGGFGHFSASTPNPGKDGPEAFDQRFLDNVRRINALVFDNGETHTVHRADIADVLPQVTADLAYFDPPYATAFSTTHYEKAYHFIEGLMTYWEGLTIKESSKTRTYVIDHPSVSKTNAKAFFSSFLGHARHIPNWLISYRDRAYPNAREIQELVGECGGEARMQSREHRYSITAKHGEASRAIEHLFICKMKDASTARGGIAEGIPSTRARAHCRTRIPIEIEPPPEGSLAARADTPTGEDPKFHFILCRAGTNRNGDHFTREELAERHPTAINKKIDLMHSQDFTDIVGGIVAADFVEDGEGGHVACTGELFTGDSASARLAYKLIRKGIVAQVSMECDYEEGECSICGKRVQSKAEYCLHLRKYKGGEYENRPCYEVLHGVTFTGLGLLDRKGADENARITGLAALREEEVIVNAPETTNIPESTDPPATPIPETDQGGAIVAKDKEPKAPPPVAAEAAKPPETQSMEPAEESPGGAPTEDAERIRQLEAENRRLKQENETLKKRIEELEMEQKAAANRARAHKLLIRLEKQGLSFGSEQEREAELKRLAEMSDEAFQASEAAYNHFYRNQSDTRPPESPASTPKTEATRTGPVLRAVADVRPKDVDDQNPNLEAQLRDGFLAAYQQRVG